MDFAGAFTYAFQDANWLKKVGLAGLIFLIPIAGPIIVMGWGLEITRRVINNQQEILPDWSDFGGFLSKGFQGFVVSLAFSLPALLINICQQGLTFGVNAAANNGNSGQLAGAAGIAMMCLGCLSFIFSLASGFITPAALGILADTGQLSSAFNFNQVIGLVRSALGPYLLQMLITGIAAMIIAPLGLLVCIIGIIFAAAYLTTVSYHLTGQSYKAARAAQGASTASTF